MAIYIFEYAFQKPGYSKTRGVKEIINAQSEYGVRQKLEEYHAQRGEKIVDIFRVKTR